MVAGAFAVVVLGTALGLDPLLAALLLAPVFYLLGDRHLRRLPPLLRTPRRRGAAGPRLLLRHHVHPRGRAGHDLRRRPALPRPALCLRHLAARRDRPAAADAGARRCCRWSRSVRCWLFLRRSFTGLAIAAVAQDAGGAAADGDRPGADQAAGLRHLGRLGRRWRAARWWWCSRWTPRPARSSSAGSSPSASWAAWRACPAASLAALAFGVVENVTATFYGPSWSPAVAFGALLLVLALRPQGLFGKAA